MIESTARPRVLIAEDEALIRLLLVDALEEAGFAVMEAGDASEAIGVLGGEGCVDLLVTDVRMPGAMDGIALARMLRGKCPDARIIVISGHVLAGAEADARAFDAFVPKPFNPFHLAERARALVTA